MTQKQLTITTHNKLLKILVIFVLAVALTIGNSSYAIADISPTSTPKICAEPPSELETKLRNNLKTKFLTYEGCPAEMGGWYMLPMPAEQDRMQAVHAVLLPNSKVLIVNGSSNRNHVTAAGKIEDGLDNSQDDVVNNTSIFDPTLSDFYDNPQPDFKTSPFRRISSPPAMFQGERNDPFCSGHLQMPNGDTLFVGGSRRYYPGVRFLGSKNANIYHWQDQTWEQLGLTKDGHWYPTLIPLADGEIASFSGLTAASPELVSTLVEIYNPTKKTWQSINVKDLPNNPFRTQMNDENFGSDLIDLYARILPTKQRNRFLITGDGGGKNEAKIAHASVHTYFVTFTKDPVTEKYAISFEKGP